MAAPLVNMRALLIGHVVVAVAAMGGALATGVVVPWSAEAWALAGWVALAAGLYALLLWRRFVARALEGYPDAAPTSGVVVTGSVSSRVVLDFDAGTAEKAYGAGSPLVRVLYALCFQAPFPYTSNVAALETAVHRRTVVGLLTKLWFGENLVAPILELRRLDDGRTALVTALVRGDVPRNVEGARALLAELTARFLESGLPVWQVADYNPRAIGNLIERPDGRFAMIDLESNFVTPFLPPGAIVRALRLGQYPSFDDVDVPRLRAYLERHAGEIEGRLAAAEAAELRASVARLAEAQARWFVSERRWLPRALRFTFRLVDVPSWVRGVRGLAGRGESMGESYVREGVATWEAEGHISPAEAAKLERALANPEVALVLANLGAHLAITIPLRFPFGSLTRFSWTLASRLGAEWRAVRHRSSAATARRVHSIPVMFATLLPSVGTGAYLLSTPLRQNSVLELVALDRVLRQLPFRLHERLHLVALMAWFAEPKAAPIHWEHWAGIRGGFVARWRTLAACPRWFWAVMSVDLAVVVVGGVLYFGFDDDVFFVERGLLASMAAVQLVAGSALGIATYRRFWSVAGLRDAQERAGTFLWGISGVGLAVFAADDYFTVHERLGGWASEQFEVLPLLTNNVDDIITLGYGLAGLIVLHVFRHEVMQRRASSALYLAAVVAAGAMLIVDAYGHSLFKLAEFPAQTGAVGLFFLAHAQRFREVEALRATGVEVGIAPADRRAAVGARRAPNASGPIGSREGAAGFGPRSGPR
jgi:hypothetical protein